MIDYSLLALQNPWWKNREAINKDSKILEFEAAKIKYSPEVVTRLKLRNGDINIVTGPRQTGKSTALKLLIRNLLEGNNYAPEHIFYFNCDALSGKKDLIDLIVKYLETIENSQNYLFLDEISSIPDWPLGIKWLADTGFLRKSKIILTGSSSISLKKSGEFLPGRRGKGKDIKFLPVSFANFFNLHHPEIPTHNLKKNISELRRLQTSLIKKGINLDQLYRDYLLSGGFLKTINLLAGNKPLAEASTLYVNTLKSELAKFGKKEINARQVLKKIISSLSAETSYTNVAEEAELGSKNTAADYLHFFTDSFFLKEVFFYNINQKRVVIKKNKKYYPVDPFLFWVFYAFTSGTNQVRAFYNKYQTFPQDSQLAEMFVAGELFKNAQKFYYFKNTREMDFYLPHEELGIEVKYKNKIYSKDLEGLKPAKNKLLISKNSLDKIDNILVVPIGLAGFLDWNNLA